MPDTPIYGFTYPCVTDPVDANDFTVLANQIDAQLAVVAAEEEYALNRYNTQLENLVAQAGIAASVETAVTGPTYTVPVDGLYLVRPKVFGSSSTTLTSARLRVRLNGTGMPGRTDYTGAFFSLTSFQFEGAFVPVVGFATNTIDMSFFWTGTGTVTITSAYMHIYQVVRIT